MNSKYFTGKEKASLGFAFLTILAMGYHYTMGVRHEPQLEVWVPVALASVVTVFVSFAFIVRSIRLHPESDSNHGIVAVCCFLGATLTHLGLGVYYIAVKVGLL